jgi:hypothetical protein
MKVVLIVLLSCAATLAQKSNDLRQKYGEPKAEMFQIRPDVDMTVTYGRDGTVCTMLIEPTPLWFGAAKFDEDTNVIKMSVVTDIFDELVPKGQRGSLSSGPRHGRVEWIYERVNLLVDGQMDIVRRARIVMKRDECQ